jgi:tRNA pseudouridine55 synthase
LDPGALESALAAFLGEIEQVPPLYSALKSGGRALHARVRAGERVAAPRARRIRIDRLAAAPLAWGAAPAIGDVSATRASDAATGDVPGAVAASAADGLIYEARLAVQCSSGTYVRALARDLAERIGTVAHVRELRRLSVGPFTVAEALAPAVLGCAAELRRARRPLETVLPHVPRIVVSADEAEDLRNGRQPPADWQARYVTAAGVGAAELLQVHDPADRLVAVCRREPTTAIWRTAAVFPLAIAQARAEGNEES